MVDGVCDECPRDRKNSCEMTCEFVPFEKDGFRGACSVCNGYMSLVDKYCSTCGRRVMK